MIRLSSRFPRSRPPTDPHLPWGVYAHRQASWFTAAVLLFSRVTSKSRSGITTSSRLYSLEGVLHAGIQVDFPTEAIERGIVFLDDSRDHSIGLVNRNREPGAV